jgi:hypothetical protein
MEEKKGGCSVCLMYDSIGASARMFGRLTTQQYVECAGEMQWSVLALANEIRISDVQSSKGC